MKSNSAFIGLFALSGLLLVGCGDDDGGGDADANGGGGDLEQDSAVYDLNNGFEEIDGATASMTRDGESATVTMSIPGIGTEGNVYTLWYVIFQGDENCIATPNDEGLPRCGLEDTEGENWVNADGMLIYGGPKYEGSIVADASGDLEWTGIEMTPDVADETLTDVGYPTTWTQINTSEIHILIQDHGVAYAEDDELYDEQFSVYMGGCNEECVDSFLAIFPAEECTGHDC